MIATLVRLALRAVRRLLGNEGRQVIEPQAIDCPHCGNRIAHNAIAGGDPVHVGDISMCITCGGFYVFDAHGLEQRLTDEAFNQIPALAQRRMLQHREILRQLQRQGKRN